ncbi:hypothetical protein [Vibrio owensii]|uniref:hypothetical protein n=1 Tax=Vibrio owensii TaxID=696485 RepID=UPI003CC58C7A
MKAYILSDGSFDSTLRVGTCGYSIVIGDETFRDTARITDVGSSTECELFGIYCGVRALRAKMREKGIEDKLQMLHIFSDSDRAFDVLENIKGKKPKDFEVKIRYDKWKNRINNSLKEITLAKTKHVLKGHVKTSEARPIELRLNEIDKLSNDALQEFRADIVRLDNDNTKICGVALQGGFRKAEAKEMYQLGYQVAHEGYRARIYGGTNLKVAGEHPFIKGFHDYCEKKGIDHQERVHLLKTSRFSWDFEAGCAGLDSAFVMTAKGTKKTSQVDTLKNESFAAASIARMIFGIQRPTTPNMKLENMVYERLEKSSEFVIDLSLDQRLNRMIDNVTSMIGLPVYKSAIEAKNELNRKRELAMEEGLTY